MNPVLHREVVKCQKAFLVFGKTLHGSRVLRRKAGQAVVISVISCRPSLRHPDVLQGLLYLRLNGFFSVLCSRRWPSCAPSSVVEPSPTATSGAIVRSCDSRCSITSSQLASACGAPFNVQLGDELFHGFGSQVMRNQAAVKLDTLPEWPRTSGILTGMRPKPVCSVRSGK